MAYALVTGASKGIGKAIAYELAKRKYDILITARSTSQLEEVAIELREKFKVKVAVLALDLATPEAPGKLYQWCIENGYPVEILVNNAGVGLSGSFEQIDAAKNENLLRLNIVSPTLLCQLFIPLLQKNKRSYILNVVSTSAYQSVPGLSVYSASKSYLLSLTRALHHELKNLQISVTAVSPGPTDTDWIRTANVQGKALAMASKVNMQPADVAKIAVDAMFAGKIEVIPGMMNKAGAFFAWLLPKAFIERTTAKLYQ